MLIVAAGLWPLRTVLRRPSGTDLAEARSLLSKLETELALAAPDCCGSNATEAERYQLLAGAALGGTPDRAACQRSTTGHGRVLPCSTNREPFGPGATPP